MKFDELILVTLANEFVSKEIQNNVFNTMDMLRDVEETVDSNEIDSINLKETIEENRARKMQTMLYSVIYSQLTIFASEIVRIVYGKKVDKPNLADKNWHDKFIHQVKRARTNTRVDKLRQNFIKNMFIPGKVIDKYALDFSLKSIAIYLSLYSKLIFFGLDPNLIQAKQIWNRINNITEN